MAGTFWPSHRCQQEESMRLSVDRDVKRLFDSPVVLPLVVLALVVVGGILRLVVARQDLFGDELATYWVVSTRGFSGGRRHRLDDGRDHAAVRASCCRGSPPGRASARSWSACPRWSPGSRRSRSSTRWASRTVGRGAALLGRRAHDAEPVHDLLLGRGAGLRRAHGAAAPVDARPAARRRPRPAPVVGALRRVRLPGGLHALHGRVRAGGPAWVGVRGCTRGPAGRC